MPRRSNRDNRRAEEPEPEDWWDVAEDVGGWAWDVAEDVGGWAGDYLEEGQARAGDALDTLAEGGADAAKRAVWVGPATVGLVLLGAFLLLRVT